MGSGTGSDIQISITVVDRNGVASVVELENAVKSLESSGMKAGAAAGDGIEKIGEHALSSRENIRLLNDDLGLRIPRAMQAAMESSQMLSGAISGMSMGLIAFGAIDIFTHIGEEIFHAYEKYVALEGVIADSDAAIKSFGASAAAAMDQAAEAHERYLRLTQGGIVADQFGLDRYKDTRIPIPQYQDDKFKGLPDEVKGDFEKLTGESIMPKDMDATIKKVQDYEAELEKALATVRAAKSTAVLGGPYSVPQLQEMTKLGKSIEIGKNLIADLLGEEKRFTQNVLADQAQIDQDKKTKGDEAIAHAKAEHDEIVSLQNAARNSELAGIDLLESQREQALAAFEAKYGSARAGIDAIEKEYASKEIDLWIQQWQEAEKVMRVAQQAAQRAAHAGAGSIENDRVNSVIDIGQKKGLDPGVADEMRNAADLKANSEILVAQEQFARQMEQIGTKSDDAQITGYAKIAEEATASAKKIEDAWRTLAEKAGALSAAGVDAQLIAADKTLDINQNMLRELGQFHQKTMDQVAKEDEQTARLSLPEWQQAQLKIVDAYQDRVREVQELEKQQNAAMDADMQAHSDRVTIDQQAEVMNAIDANAKILAARQLMNAEMQRSDQETRDKLASGLQSFLQNPAQFLEKRAMDTAYQYLGNEMMQLFQQHPNNVGTQSLSWLFGMNGQASTSTNPETFGKSLLGTGGGAAADTLSLGASTLQTGATTLQTAAMTQQAAAQALLQYSSTVSVGGGPAGLGGGLGSDMSGMGGFGGISAGFSGGGSFTGMGAGGDAGIGPALAGLDATGAGAGDGMGNFGGVAASGLDQNAATASAAASPWLGAAGAAITGGMGIYSAFENSNPMAGGVAGAMAGAAIGSAFAPGVGTAIGAIVGGVAGILAGVFGDQGKGKAQDLDNNTVQPGIVNDLRAYGSGTMGYDQATQALYQMQIQAEQQTQTWGSGARGWYSNHILPEITAARLQLNNEEKGGRSLVAMSAAQYHGGGMIGDFGDLALNADEGLILAQRGEMMMNASAASSFAPALHAMNSGALSPSTLRGSQMVPASIGEGGPQVNLTIQAIDAQSFADWARKGGALQLRQAMNVGTRQYGGQGIR